MTEEKLKEAIEVRSNIRLIEETIRSLQDDIREEKLKLGMLFVDDSEAEKIEKGEFVLYNLPKHPCSNSPERFWLEDANTYDIIREFFA